MQTKGQFREIHIQWHIYPVLRIGNILVCHRVEPALTYIIYLCTCNLNAWSTK